MKFVYTEKKADVPAELHAYAEKKIGKLERLFRGESTAYVTFSNKQRGIEKVEVTVRNNGLIYRASESTSDMFASVDAAVSAIERQIAKNKTRLAKRLREGAVEQELSVPTDEPEENEFDVVRTKRFSIKPMSVEEAILQMNLLEHEFFVFKKDTEDGAFSIVYKRKDGGYGLIESTEE
jgi:putative sigma-54 modulation protein